MFYVPPDIGRLVQIDVGDPELLGAVPREEYVVAEVRVKLVGLPSKYQEGHGEKEGLP